MSDGLDAVAVPGGEAAVEAGKAAAEGREYFGTPVPHADAVQELVERHGALSFQRVGVGELGLGHADRVDDHEAVLMAGVGGDGVEVGGRDGAYAAALHLLEEAAAADVAHEEDDLDRLDVGTGGNHVHGDDDAGVVAVSERGEQVFGVVPGGLVGDLPAERVALAELLADDADNVVGVAVVLGEDDRLGHDAAVREYLREELVPERPYDGANLVFGHDIAIELVGGVDQVVLELLRAYRSESSGRAGRRSSRRPRSIPAR